MQLEAPGLLYLPEPQDMQLAEPVDPVLLPYVPAEQGVQLEAPVILPYVPTEQVVQLEAPTLLNVPAGQLVQIEELVAPVMLPYVPAAQDVHFEAPVLLSYVP